MTKTRVDAAEAMVKIRDCIGELPHGYMITQSPNWLRVFPGFKDSDRWDRPGLEFHLALPKRGQERTEGGELQLVIKIQVDLPTFLESNIMVTGLRQDLELYSRLWFKVGEMGATLEIIPC